MKELTHEQKEKLKGCYLIIDRKMIAIGNPIELTTDNFKAYWIDTTDTIQELNAMDFKYAINKDFIFDKNWWYGTVYRNNTPPEVRKLLDDVISGK